jgi:AraC-like DNA-binding protein
MKHCEFETPVELRDTITCFWYERRDLGERTTGIEVMPDGHAEIIFHFGSGCSIAHQGALRPLPSPFMVGLLDRPAHFYAKDRFEIIGIRCFPWTVFDLLGLPSGKERVNVFEHPIAQLQALLDPLVHADRVEEAVVLVEQYFMNARSRVPVDSMLFKAGVAMREANGTRPVGRIAEAAHATVRTLERKFKRSAGHTVKDVSGLMRFEQVRNQLWVHPHSNLAGLAHEFGYADQPHLSREFKRYSGTTPAAFAREAKKRKLALGNELVAFIQA